MNSTNVKNTTIKLLHDNPNCIPELVNIWRDVLGKVWVPDVTPDAVMNKLQTHLNTNALPLTFVAFIDDTPVGMCSLRENDGIRPDLTPWLGSLVVRADCQNMGIGDSLVKATSDKAREMEFSNLYLFTFDPTLPQYYSRFGWSFVDNEKFKGQMVTVMEKELINDE